MSKGNTAYGYSRRVIIPVRSKTERIERMERIRRHILIADAVRGRPPAQRNPPE